jgi:hypothetical protein
MLEPKRRSRLSKTACSLVCGCGLAVALVPTSRAELDAVTGVRASASDNVNLEANDPDSDVLLAPFVELEWLRESPDLDASADADLSYVTYLDDTNEDRVVGSASVVGDWHIVPERLNLHVENRFGQSRRDELATPSPDNTEDVNIFSIGPDVMFDLSSVDEVTFSARYGQSYYEDEADTERVGGGVRLSHEFSSITRGAISLRRQEVEYTEPAQQADVDIEDYTIDEAGVGLERLLPRGRTDLTVGQRRLEEADGETLEEPFARLSLAYEAGPRTRLRLDAEHGLSGGAGRVLGDTGASIELPDGTGGLANEIAVESDLRASLERGRERTSYRIGVRARELDFEDPGEVDQERVGATLTATYPVSALIEARGRLAFTRTDYVARDRTDDIAVVRARLRYLLTRRYYTEAGYQYRRQSSTNAGRDYDENRVFVSIAYRWDPAETTDLPENR